MVVLPDRRHILEENEMKAAQHTRYGDEQNLHLVELPLPKPGPNDVVLQVVATSINASDWEFLSGTPAYSRIMGLTKPRKVVLGSDISGIVVAVGANVSEFAIGDEVFCDNFEVFGGFAEMARVPVGKLLRKPATLSHVQASAIPQSAVIALQALRKYGEVTAGQQVLINGGGGGAGSFAIQFAKQAGAHVTAVDHANKLAFMSELGADAVIDYQHQDVTHGAQRFDKIVDFVGHHSVRDYFRILQANGSYVIVGGLLRDILSTLTLGSLLTWVSGKRMSILAHQQNATDIMSVVRQVEQGNIRVCVDRTYPLQDIRSAFQHFREQKVLGKVVIEIEGKY